MQLTLRSQLIAGVATVGAAAMVVAPIAQPDLLPSMQRVSTAVQLTSFDNPVSVLFATLADATANLINQVPLPGTAFEDPRPALQWPESFYDGNFPFAPGYLGLIPDFANQVSFGGLSAVVGNLSGYGYAAVEGLLGLVGGPITAVSNVPFAIVTAAGFLAAGRPDLALAELQTQILGPLQQGIGTALAAVGYVIDNVVTNASTLVLNAIPGLVSKVLNETIVPGALYIGQSAITALGTAVAQLTAGQFEAAWNTAVNGLLGPNGTLGQLEKLTIGVGIVEDRVYSDGVFPTVVVPSLRSDVTSAGQRLGDLSTFEAGGIRNNSFFDPFTVPTTSAAVSAASAVVASKVSAAEVARPVAGEASALASADEAVSADVTVADAGSSADASAAATDAEVNGGVASGSASSNASAPAKAKSTRGHARGASAE